MKKEKKNFFANDYNGSPQFSKIIVFLCLLFSILGTISAVYVSIAYYVTETIVCAVIAGCNAVGVTAVTFMLKKSQAENTIKLYTSAYKEIIKMNPEKSYLVNSMEEKMVGGIDNVIDNSLNDAVSAIEKQEII